MARPSSDQFVWVEKLAAEMPFYRFMGIRLNKLSSGRSEIKLRANAELTQQAGIAHGGVSAALVDSAVGLALCTVLEPATTITTIRLQVNFLAPAKPGILTARGRIIHRGNRTAIGECDVVDDDGKLVSRGTATYMILGKRKKTRN